MERATAHLQGLGMRVTDVKNAKKINTKASFLTSNSIFESDDATVPEREVCAARAPTTHTHLVSDHGVNRCMSLAQVGATLLSFDDPKLCTGCLLLPPRSKKKLTTPPPPTQLRVVGGLPDAGAPTVSPDGLPAAFVSAADFEAAVKKA
eukprot:33252-Prymnesium_polylepis.2